MHFFLGVLRVNETVPKHPKHMLKFMGKKYLQFYAEIFYLSKPVVTDIEEFLHDRCNS